MTDPDDRDLTAGVSDSLDRSLGHLDAATLSRLNQARHHALAVRRRRNIGLPWLTTGSVAAVAVAILASRLLLTSPAIQTDDMPLTGIDVAEFITAGEDLEMLEDLEFVAWMVAQDNAG